MSLQLKATCLGTAFAAFLVSGSAIAQSQPADTSRPAGGAQPSARSAESPEQKRAEAEQRFKRGIQMYDDGNYDAARVEFERAYQLVPSYRILFNLGLCSQKLGDYVQAQRYLRRYLDIGGGELAPERRSEVDRQMAEIVPSIARGTVVLNVPGTEISVDDQCATESSTADMNCGVTTGTTRQILMNPGRRRISARKSGFLPETRVVTVAGGDQLEVRLDLKPLGRAEEKKNPYVVPMWVGWGLTGAAAITSVVAGITALSARSDQKDANARFGESRADLDDLRTKTNTWATVTDVALIGTGVLGAASVYLTVRALGWKGDRAPLNVEVGTNRLGVSGRF